MQGPNSSLQIPLLNNQSSQPQKKGTYYKSGFFDYFLLFWVDKLIKVMFSPHQKLISLLDWQKETFPTRHALESEEKRVF